MASDEFGAEKPVDSTEAAPLRVSPGSERHRSLPASFLSSLLRTQRVHFVRVTDVIDLLHVSATGFAWIFGSVVVGAIVQGSIGFGLNLIVVPVAAVAAPAALPATMIIIALPMTAGSALRERQHIDVSGVLWTTLGRLPGVVVGAWIVASLGPETLSVLVGGIVALAALMSVLSPEIRLRRRSAAGVGFVAGVMGTASSIGGPPIALLYQHAPGPVVRSTLGAAFLLGTMLSLAALGAAGQVAGWQWLLAIALTPGVALGLYASRFLHGWLDAGWLRPCVLVFATIAGIGVLLRGIL